MSDRDELVARLHTIGLTTARNATDQIKRDGREIERQREQLRLIADADEADLMLDPLWAKRMARAALNGEGET